MKRLLFLVVALVLGLSATTAAAPPVTAGSSGPDNWPALLNCADVNADGSVSMIDIGQVVVKFGTQVVLDSDESGPGAHYVPGPGYMLLYDLDGGGFVGTTDIGVAVGDFGTICPLVETQVAAATLATAPFQDWSAAQAAGYTPNTQYTPQMGIHAGDGDYTMNFDHTSPIGLIYKSSGGTPDELIGLYYVIPTQDVCNVFTVQGPCQPDDESPEGFDGPEDNTDINSVQRGWHTHINLCIAQDGVYELGPGYTHADCKAPPFNGYYNFPVFGWMVHLYNFIPNSDGRFMMWNTENLP